MTKLYTVILILQIILLNGCATATVYKCEEKYRYKCSIYCPDGTTIIFNTKDGRRSECPESCKYIVKSGYICSPINEIKTN